MSTEDEAAVLSLTEPPPNPWGLSLREWQVMHGMVTIASQKAVAVYLGMAPKTVSTYVDRVRVKMNQTNTVMTLLTFDRWARQAVQQ